MAGVVLAATVSLCWNVASLWIGPRLGVVDHPDDSILKTHDRPAVPLGGVGIFLGVHLGLWLEGMLDPGLLAATAVLLMIGLIDDLRHLSPIVRLAGEGIAGVLLVFMSDIPGVDGDLMMSLIGVLLVVVCVNAVNLFDGLDGLVGTSMVATGTGIAVLGLRRELDSAFGWVLVAALLGFLVLNWHRARVFLGDNGAYVVGAMLAYGILSTTRRGAGSDLVIGLGLLGVFGLDVVVAVLRRKLYGRPLFDGDRSHIYDQLRDRGMSIPKVAIVVAGAQAIVVAVVLAADGISGPAGAVVVAVLGVALLVAARIGGFLRVDGLG